MQSPLPLAPLAALQTPGPQGPWERAPGPTRRRCAARSCGERAAAAARRAGRRPVCEVHPGWRQRERQQGQGGGSGPTQPHARDALQARPDAGQRDAARLGAVPAQSARRAAPCPTPASARLQVTWHTPIGPCGTGGGAEPGELTAAPLHWRWQRTRAVAGRPRYPEPSASFQRRLVEWSDSGGAGRGREPGTGGWAPGGPRVTVLPRPSECARGGGARAKAGARAGGRAGVGAARVLAGAPSRVRKRSVGGAGCRHA